MKILIVNIYDGPEVSGGGAEMSIHHLTQALLKLGHTPVILATSSTPGVRRVERNGIAIWQVGLRNIYWPETKIQKTAGKRFIWHLLDSYNILMQPLLKQVLNAEKPDVVSLHIIPGWSVAAWKTIYDSGIPAVQVLHDAYLICPNSAMYADGKNCIRQCATCRLLRLFHRGATKYLSAVVGVSRYILNRHLENGYFKDVPVKQYIHNARDPFELGISAQQQERVGGIRFGFIGRLDPSKGVEKLLQAFSRAALPNARLLLAGTGRNEYENTLKVNWQSDQIRFLGRVSQQDFFTNVDVVVVPSLWQEPLGMVVAESFAFGKMVIGARRGGIPEMIVDGENGFLFDPDNVEELTALLIKVSAQKELVATMSISAKNSAHPFLNVEEWAGKYIRIYEQVISSSRRL